MSKFISGDFKCKIGVILKKFAKRIWSETHTIVENNWNIVESVILGLFYFIGNMEIIGKIVVKLLSKRIWSKYML